MSKAIGELAGDVLDVLMKTPGFGGFFTAEKVYRAIQDSIDYVASLEVDSASDAWTKKIRYLDTTAGCATVDIPDDVLVIRDVRYMVANVYIPLMYDRADNQPQFAPNAGVTQLPNRYRIVENKLYFNPPMQMGGQKYLQLEFTGFPQVINPGDTEAKIQFNRALCNYIKFRSASLLASTNGQYAVPWQRFEDQWFERTMVIINKRADGFNCIRNFEG